MIVSVPVARRAKAPVSDAWVKKMVAAALKGSPRGRAAIARAREGVEIGAVFVGDAEMKKLNAAHRGLRATTDVLSFGNDAAWPTARERRLLGDVVISVPQAARQGEEAGTTVRRELALLLVHGVLHLLGYDHASAKEEAVMFGWQRKILRKQRQNYA